MPNSRERTHSRHLLRLVAAIAVVCAVSFPAQDARGASSVQYDAQSETKIKGTVEEVKMPSGAKEIVYLVMKTGDASVEVYLCPKSFLDDMGISFAKGEEITLTGSKIKQGDAEVILAREILKGSDTILFRDDKGKPVWS